MHTKQAPLGQAASVLEHVTTWTAELSSTLIMCSTDTCDYVLELALGLYADTAYPIG